MKQRILLSCLLSSLLLTACGGSDPAPATNTPVPTLATPTVGQPAAASATSGESGAATATNGAASAATETPAAAANTTTPAVTATTTPAVITVPVVTPPAALDLTPSPPTVPAPTAFSGTPGSDAAGAVAVTVPVTITAKFAADEKHWFKLDLSKYKGGTLTLHLQTPKTEAGGMHLELDNADGDKTVDYKDVESGSSADLVVAVESAVYTVQTSGRADAPTPYTLGLTFAPNGSAADKDSALKIGLSGTVKATLNSTSDQQWYLLDMNAFPQGGQVAVDLATPAKATGPYQLDLYAVGDTTNPLDYKDLSPGDKGTLIAEPMTATNYYVLVTAHGGFDALDPYTLTTTFTPHSAHGTAKTALPITAPVLLHLLLPAPGDVVYFSFPAPANSKVTALLMVPNDGNPIQAEFYDVSGQNSLDYASVAPGDPQKALTVALANADTYVLAVTRKGGTAVSNHPTDVELRLDSAP